MILTGLSLHDNQPIPKDIWEEIPYEEVQTIERQERKAEDIPVPGPVQEIQSGELTKKPEEEAGPVNEFTYDDAQLLMRIAQSEAGNQGEDGMWLVMSVVLNRVDSSEFPNSIKDVIYQAHQFSSVSDGHFDEAVISPDAHEALARIEQGEVAEQIIGFEVKDSKELDKYFTRAFEFKDHRFYTMKGD